MLDAVMRSKDVNVCPSHDDILFDSNLDLLDLKKFNAPLMLIRFLSHTPMDLKMILRLLRFKACNGLTACNARTLTCNISYIKVNKVSVWAL